MTRGTRKKKSVPRKTTVSFAIGGATIMVDELPASKAGPVLAAIIDVVRELQKKYPELRVNQPTIGGYCPVEVWDDWSGDEGRRKVGFQTGSRRNKPR